MDNCDLEKLAISGQTLQPAFKADVTTYKVTVTSDVDRVTLDLLTSDCGACYKIRCGDGSKSIRLNDGLNLVEIEVVAEDGTSKKYCIEVTKLSARTAELSDLTIEGNVQLQPTFSANIYDYSSTVPFYCNSVTILPKVPDRNMKVSVNEESDSQPSLLTVGETSLSIKVLSADGSNSQMYYVLVIREQIPMAVSFSDVKEQVYYECPVTLTALYRPISINQSDPQHLFSAPYIDMLARRSKVDPLNECPLGDRWKVLEHDLDKTMSSALVKCFFAYRGCESVMKLAEVGSHALECPHKPSADLDQKDVTETSWYKKHFASSTCLEIETKHTLEVHNWEKRLQKAIGQDSADNLCSLAQDNLKLYRERLPKPGDLLQYEDGQSPLDCLEQAAVHYASAIKLKPRDPRLHFLLGLALEEQHYAAEMYGLRRKADGDVEDLSSAKYTARQDDILAVCKLHGFPGTPTMENQLQALDTEYHQLKEQGQSGKADYIQTLFIFLSKKAGKDGSAGVGDEESCIHRALLKYLDAWSLNKDFWEYNLHVGRMLLLQKRNTEALQHLQTGLALRPSQPALRFFTGLALLLQEEASEAVEEEAALFLQQGLEHVIAQYCNTENNYSGLEQSVTDPLSSVRTQFLRGCLTLGALLHQKNTLSQKPMSAEQVYHSVVVLAARGVCRCVCRDEVAQQLEWVLLDAHFALLQSLIQQKKAAGLTQGQGKQGETERQAWVTKRCQALTGLILLTSIPACRELLDMQEKVCQVAVVTAPRDSHALCLLGLAQLAQCDNDHSAQRLEGAIANACLSFQASIELEDKPQSGEPPTQLTKQQWWQDRLAADKEKAVKETDSQGAGGGGSGPSDTAVAAGRGCGRGMGGPAGGGTAAAAKTPTRGGKTAPLAKNTPSTAPPAKNTVSPASRGQGGAAKTLGPAKPSSSKTQLISPSKSKPDCSPSPAKPGPTEESAVAESGNGLPKARLNHRSHAPRLGLARALSRSADSHDQARQLYQEVITMAPEVHDAYIELAEMLGQSDPLAAVEVYCRFPLKPVSEQNFDDAFITGEIVRILMKQGLYEHPELGHNLIAYGKVMGLGCLEKYIDILEGKFMSSLLKRVYAGIHDKSVEDKDLQDFFKFKCWI
ncbi:uncharacterized protein isoform X3 [Salmo salar]|uniref:Uncharacterized protein isoform X3 n=1 Tax=Salmo salar TaxID=8030 RepID=A0ABM3E5C0_SALSA|nr:uncharacterized protein LOC106590859 isoform X3 [Salmo salar]|eukprot:XP_014037511.1 PREDICTED: uncharacterized protein LOC106590859 [Salmo salar]